MRFNKFRSYWDTIKNPPETSLITTQMCDIKGCPNRGDYRAPKSRQQLQDYYWFCLEHVQEYNRNWDYFKGMTPEEVEEQIAKNMVGDRPTWRATQAGMNEDKLKQRIYKTFKYHEDVFHDFHFNGNKETKEQFLPEQTLPKTAIEALKTIGLEHPAKWTEVKAAYKRLVKKYHPDRTQGNKSSEEQMKNINLAYSILKMSYQKYLETD